MILDYLIPFLILLSVVVFVHEYGHYYFAKKYGVGITTFSIGFGKELFGWTDKSGTRWKFCLIPLGGYVKFFGDHNIFSDYNREELKKKYDKADHKKLFGLKKLYQRNLILLGGPLANFILAFIVFFFIFMFVGKDFTTPSILEVKKDSPAAISGLKKNDIIIEIDQKKIISIHDVSKFINLSSTDFIEFTVLRNDVKYKTKVKPNLIKTKDGFGNMVDKKVIGIMITPYNDKVQFQKLGPVKSIKFAFKEVYFVSSESLKYLWGLIQKIWGKGYGDINQLGGPIKIAQISGKVAEYGILPFIMTMAYISISLGLINLFPIPLLDGGHITINTIEAIRGKEYDKKTIEFSYRIGLAIIASLIFFTTINDIKGLLN